MLLPLPCHTSTALPHATFRCMREGWKGGSWTMARSEVCRAQQPHTSTGRPRRAERSQCGTAVGSIRTHAPPTTTPIWGVHQPPDCQQKPTPTPTPQQRAPVLHLCAGGARTRNPHSLLFLLRLDDARAHQASRCRYRRWPGGSMKRSWHPPMQAVRLAKRWCGSTGLRCLQTWHTSCRMTISTG